MSEVEQMIDMRGLVLRVGDEVVYGKSDRRNPISIGKIISFSGNFVYILGEGNTKAGSIHCEEGFCERVALLDSK